MSTPTSPTSPASSPSPSPSTPSARVLIVDDEPHIRTVMRLALENSGRGYQIGEASSGEEALEAIGDTRQWDLILLDERMPGIDGLETLTRLHRSDPGIVVIMVTAFASIELAVDAMKIGATDFLRKPMTPETLRAAVAGALAKSRGEWPGEVRNSDAPPVPDAAIGSAASVGTRPDTSPKARPGAETSPAATERPYEVWMFNGFRVRHVSAGATALEQRFELRRSDAVADVRTAVVTFAPDVVAAVADEAGRSMDADAPFWIRQAAFALVHHVWSQADAPPQGRLVVTRLSDGLLKAARALRRLA